MATKVHETGLAGQPPKFREEYCQMLIDHMATGLSYESFSAVIDTHRSTLYNWEKQFPQFFDAKKKAVEQCQSTWEKIGMAMTLGDKKKGKGAVPVWIFNMKNRFNWADKVEATHGGHGITIRIDKEDEKL